MNLKKKARFLKNGNHQLLKYFLFFAFVCMASALQGQALISVRASDATGAETLGAPTNRVRFTIRKGLFVAGGSPITVRYAISGTATNGVDYTMLSGSLTIPGTAPVSETAINVPIIDDALVEGEENITLTLLPSPDYTISGTQGAATAIISDNDRSIVNVTATDPNATESTPPNDDAAFTIDLGAVNNSSSIITLSFIVAPSSTATIDDYIGAGGNAFVLPGDQRVNIPVRAIDDTEIEGDETLTITLDDVSLSSFIVRPNTSATITIADNDCLAGATAPNLNSNSPDFCDVAGVNLDTFYNGTAPAGTALRWSTVANPTAAAQLVPPATASNAPAGTYHAVFWSDAQTCASPSAPPLVITINESPEAGTPQTGLFSCNVAANGDTTFDLDDALVGADSGGTWIYLTGPPTASITIQPNGEVDFDTQLSGNYRFGYTVDGAGACSDDSVEVIIAVSDCDPCIAGNVAPVLNTAIPTVFCGPINVNLNDYTNSMPPMGTVLRWSFTEPTDTDVPDAVSPANPGRGTYYGYFYDATNDCASPALQVIIAQNTAPMITNTTGGTRCGAGPVTFTAQATGNATFNWYTSETGGAVAGTGANFTPNLNQTTTYYLVATENGCPTSPRVPVTGTVQLQPSAGTPATGASSCNNPAFGTTTLDLDTLLTAADAGTWAFSSGPADVPINTENDVDFNTRPDGIYVYTFTTTGAQVPCANESVEVSISVSSCDTDADGDGLLGGLEATLGTDPNDVDSDNDLINDNVEVGADTENPLDEDGDGIIDALDSNLADSDSDGVVDQLDPANENACIPDNTNILCDEPIDLEVIKEIDNPDAVIGDEITFTITVNNLGPRAAKTIIIGDFLESGFEFKSDIPSSGMYDQDTGQWQLTDLASEASATLSITVTVVADENEMYSNTAELLSSDPLDSNPANDISTVALGVEQPEGVTLSIEKTARLGPDKQRLQALAGLVNDVDNRLMVEYFIKVTNESEAAMISNVSVRDVFETDSDIVFGIADDPDPNVPEGSTFNTSTGVWVINKSLEAGEEIELSYTVFFEGVGAIVNTAEIVSPVNNLPESTDISSSVTLEIATRNELEVGILYNQFSPNADGINDDLKVNFLRKDEFGFDEFATISYDIEIYNRYGTLVFEATGLTEEKAWDGTWKGKQVPDGTYFYGLNVTIEGEPGIKTSKGWIQLIR